MLTSRGFRRVCWVLLSLTLPPLLLSCSGDGGQHDSKSGDDDGADTVRLNKVIADQTEAVRLNPKDASAYYKRGLCYDEKGEADKAIADFTDAIRLNEPRAYVNRATCYQKR